MGFYKYIFTNIFGWKIKGTMVPSIKKAVVIVVPHTSWTDFFIGVMVRGVLDIQINFVGKKELFKWPLGWYFKWMGGASLDRTPGQNKVEAIAQLFAEREEFRLSLAPEGTRKKVSVWKTGYYWIALKADVPIFPVAFDYKTKTVIINPPFYPTRDIEKDTAFLREYYKDVVGKIAQNS